MVTFISSHTFILVLLHHMGDCGESKERNGCEVCREVQWIAGSVGDNAITVASVEEKLGVELSFCLFVSIARLCARL